MPVALAALGLLAAVQIATSQNLPFPGGGGVAGPASTTFDSATNTNSGTLTNGNLTYQVSTTNVVRSGRFALTKFCFSYNIDTGTSGAGSVLIGVVDSAQATVTPNSVASVPIGMWGMRDDSLKINNGASGAYGSNFGAGASKQICVDNTLGSGSGKVWIGECSAGTVTWPSSGNPVTGANAMFSNLTGSIGALVNYQAATGTPKLTANFGQSAPACSYPSGYSNL